MIGNPAGVGDGVSYKLAAPGHDLGTLSSDGPSAIVGRVGSLPPSTILRLRARDTDTRRTIVKTTNVADETDVDDPLGSSLSSLIAPLGLSDTAAVALSGGPVRQSGRLCARITLRESKVPLRFCNRYVSATPSDNAGSSLPDLMGADLSEALTTIDTVTYRRLHIAKIDARVDEQRGLQEGYMVRGRMPRHVRPGQVAGVRLTVRMTGGGLREVSFKVRVPRDVKPGVHALALVGTATDDGGAGGLVIDLGDLLGGGGSDGGDPGPQSVAELRDSVEGIERYDGVTGSFAEGSSRRHDPGFPAFLDGKVRIGGSIAVPYRVVHR